MATLVDVVVFDTLADVGESDVEWNTAPSGAVILSNYRYQGNLAGGTNDESNEDDTNSGMWSIIGGPNA